MKYEPVLRSFSSVKQNLACILLTATIAIATPFPAIATVNMNSIREQYEQARVDPDKVDSVISEVDKFLSEHKDDPVALAYKGSLFGMKARDAFFPWNKTEYVKIASDLLESAYDRRGEAAKLSTGETGRPGDLVILLSRGITYANFPQFLGRGTAAQQSLQEALDHPAFSKVAAVDRAMALAHLAVLLDQAGRKDQAQGYLIRAREANAAEADKIWRAK